MVDAERVQPHHMRLRADQVAVPAGDVHERPDADLLLHDGAERHVAHARHRERIVGHRKGVRPRIPAALWRLP